jgi:hypothetical protein
MWAAMGRWWRGTGSRTVFAPSLDDLGTVSTLWLRQHRQQDHGSFDGVTWTWPTTTKRPTDMEQTCVRNTPPDTSGPHA